MGYGNNVWYSLRKTMNFLIQDENPMLLSYLLKHRILIKVKSLEGYKQLFFIAYPIFWQKYCLILLHNMETYVTNHRRKRIMALTKLGFHVSPPKKGIRNHVK